MGTSPQAGTGDALPSRKSSRRKPAKPEHEPVHDASPVPNAPPYLDLLPDELLLCVLEHLDAQYILSKARIQQFYNICLTSRRLNRLGNNFLYEEFDSRIWTHPAKFLRTIIGNKDLASRVKTMWWHFEMLDRNWKDSFMPSSTDRRQLRESLKNLRIRDRAVLEDQYCQGRLSQLFMLALLHTPNVRQLVVNDDTPSYRHIPRICYQATSYINLLSNAAKGTPVGLSPVYSHLHSLHIRMGDMVLEDLLAIFRLPSLQKLILIGINGARDPTHHDLLESLRDTSPVTELTVLDSFLDSHTLAHLISACRELRNFVFVYNSRIYTVPLPKINYAQIGKGLRKHKKTLKVVDLDDISDRTLHVITDYDRGVLGSFHDFEKLEFFGAPIEAFTAINDESVDLFATSPDDADYIPFARLGQVLPKNLLHLALTIFEDEEHSDFCSSSLELLHRTYHEDLPKLHKIEVKAHKLVYMKSIDLWVPKHKFLNSGVSFIVSQEGILEEDLEYSSDEDTITDSEAYDGFSDDIGPLGLDGFLDMASDMDIESDHDEDDNSDDDADDVQYPAHSLEALLDVMDTIQGATQGVNAAMAGMLPLLASLQAGHLHHHLHHHHHEHHHPH